MSKRKPSENALTLDPVLHQPVRTRLVAFLAARGEATFTELKTALDITDGNLDAHIKKLAMAGYLLTHKLHGKHRPQTVYTLSGQGDKAFAAYVLALNKLLNPTAEEANEQTLDNRLNAPSHPA